MGTRMKKQLAKRIELLDRLRTDLESKYGQDDELVLDLVQEIKALRSKISDLKNNLGARKHSSAVKFSSAQHL
jgi:peptidoglycan hydrolase CwlO-like protein